MDKASSLDVERVAIHAADSNHNWSHDLDRLWTNLPQSCSSSWRPRRWQVLPTADILRREKKVEVIVCL